MLNSANAIATVPVKNVEVASKFYEEKLGLKPIMVEENVRHYKSGNSTIEVYESEFAGTNKGTTLSWTVGDEIEKEVQELKKKGIQFEHYDMPEARLEGDLHIMGDMKAAWFRDPDGNILCVHNH